MTVNIIMFYPLIIYDPIAYSFLSNYDTEFFQMRRSTSSSLNANKLFALIRGKGTINDQRVQILCSF